MSKSTILASVQDPQEAIDRLQILFQELQQDKTSNDTSHYLNQAAIQNFILSFQELEGIEGAEEGKGKDVVSKTQTKQILSFGYQTSRCCRKFKQFGQCLWRTWQASKKNRVTE